MAKFILFTDEKCLLYQHKIRRHAIQKLNHFASGAC